MVDAVVTYDSMKTYLLVVLNALHVSSMEHNLLPPFVLHGEAGIEFNDVPKIQVKSPTERDHSIWFPNEQVRIPLSLWDIFSYFPTRKLTVTEVEEAEDVFVLTPEGRKWNPHSDSYARNEESMLDWEGNMVALKDRLHILVEDLPEDDNDDMTVSSLITTVESYLVSKTVSNIEPIGRLEDYSECVGAIREADTVLNAVLASVTSTLNPVLFPESLEERHKIGAFAASTIGATTTSNEQYLIPVKKVWN